MDKSASKSFFGIAIALGAVWGLSEAALGMGLRSCAAMVSGALMTGVALSFMAAGWVLTRRVLGVALMILIAAGFKMFDALLLGYALNHGAIGNPIFAFVMEGLAFLVIVAVLKQKLTQKPAGQALAGGMAALVAANLFPLVHFATGVPACVVAGTGYPLSLYYIHIAVAVSMATVPLGFWLGARIRAWESRLSESGSRSRWEAFLSPAALALCLAVVAFIRLI
ncbi:MAG: hypothetical protein WBB73_09205 [Candidatus Aminicenantaceae bacterium]